MDLPDLDTAREEIPTSILLVEDEPLIRCGLAETLRDEGLHVIEAANADEAWELLESGAHVDIVFSDINMPGSIDGLGLARRIKGRHSHVPIILTSGKVSAQEVGTLAQFMAKPFPFSAAAALIVRTLKK
jgi:CheY-like chemotaxis protein